MRKLSKKGLTALLIIIGLALLLIGIILSISIESKDISLKTLADSLFLNLDSLDSKI